MRLLRRQAADRSEPPEADEELYVAADVSAGPAHDGTELVLDGLAGRTHALPAHLAGILPYCAAWDTLEGHARRLLGRGWSSAGDAMLMEALRELASRGILLSRSDFLRRVAPPGEPEAPPAPISTTVWCTRDRPESLARSIVGHVRADREHGRRGSYLVLDDGEEARSHPLFRAAAPAGLLYAGRAEKLSLAAEIERLGRADGVPREVIDFALFGTADSRWTVGANRNAGLLLAGGETYLSVDDDTECLFCGPPGGAPGAGLELDSTSDPTEHWFFSSREELVGSVHLGPTDIRAVHEELLGKPVGACVTAAASGGTLDLERCAGRFAAVLVRGQGRVVATTSGICGDSAAGGPRFLLGLRAASRERLVAAEPGYGAARVCRESLRLAPRKTVSEGPSCFATCMALDNRELLPPFFPVGRNEDGVFGQALRSIVPGAYLGHVPIAVYHAPPEPRRYDPEAIRGFSLGVGDLMILLLRAFDPGPAPLEPRVRLERAGRYLAELGAMPVGDLLALLRRRLLEALEPYVIGLESALQEYGREPREWADDVDAHLSRLMAAAAEPEFGLPADLGEGRSAEEVAAAFRSLLGRYGSLLVWWPSIVGAARRAVERRERLLAAL